jgi:hypothetical protein
VGITKGGESGVTGDKTFQNYLTPQKIPVIVLSLYHVLEQKDPKVLQTWIPDSLSRAGLHLHKCTQKRNKFTVLQVLYFKIGFPYFISLQNDLEEV